MTADGTNGTNPRGNYVLPRIQNGWLPDTESESLSEMHVRPLTGSSTTGLFLYSSVATISSLFYSIYRAWEHS